MKPLTDLTLQDAKDIAKAGYPSFFHTRGSWELIDQSKELNEPCKVLKAKNKTFSFWFFKDKIDLDNEDDENVSTGFADWVYHASPACYVQAHLLGYHIPQFDKLFKD